MEINKNGTNRNIISLKRTISKITITSPLRWETYESIHNKDKWINEDNHCHKKIVKSSMDPYHIINEDNNQKNTIIYTKINHNIYDHNEQNDIESNHTNDHYSTIATTNTTTTTSTCLPTEEYEENDHIKISQTPPPIYYNNISNNVPNSINIFYRGGAILTNHLSAKRFYEIIVDYIEELYNYCLKIAEITFYQLSQMLYKLPNAIQYIQSLVKKKLHIPWHLVNLVVKYVTDFIKDEDICEATINEMNTFFKSLLQNKKTTNSHMNNIQNALNTGMFLYPQTIKAHLLKNKYMDEKILKNNINETNHHNNSVFDNLIGFFKDTLTQFKYYLTDLWVKKRKINFPCEFGKKSENLFLCMECHREHR